MVSESLFCREEAPAIVAEELANFAVLRNFMSEAVVLSREAFIATKCTGEGRARFRLVGLQVHLESILAGKPALAADDDTRETTAGSLRVDDIGLCR